LKGLLVEANRSRTGELELITERPRPRGRRPMVLAAVLVLSVAVLALAALAFVLATRKGTAPVVEARPPLPRAKVTVAQAGPADYRSIAEALARVGPGSTIRVTDAGTYAGPLNINEPERWEGLTLVAEGGATLVATDTRWPVVRIDGTPGVTLRGFAIPTREHQFGVEVVGQAEGTTLDALRLSTTAGSNHALVWIHDGARGTTTRPIRVARSTFLPGNLGVVVEGMGTVPVQFIEVEGNRFRAGRRESMHIQLLQAVQHARVRGNVCVGGVGLLLNLEHPEECGPVEIVNNSFFEARYWLNPLKSGRLALGDVAVINNLILAAEQEQADQYALLGNLADRWSFRNNWWRPGSWARSAPAGLVAALKPSIEVLSSDPGHPDFLRPSPAAPHARAGAGGSWPAHVGAQPPASR
jgi:hypothetical protein